MESLSKSLERLNLQGEPANLEAALEDLLTALDSEDLDSDEASKKIEQDGTLAKLKPLLAGSSVNASIVAKVIAEIAKNEQLRVPCVEAGLVPELVSLLDSPSLPTLTQAGRALGNICFDNDAGRTAIVAVGGVERLLRVLERTLPLTEDGASRARMVACGFLLNLCNTHSMKLQSVDPQQAMQLDKNCLDSPTDHTRLISLQLKLDTPRCMQACVQERAVAGGALDLLSRFLHQCSDDEAVCQFALLCVGCLADSEWGQDKLGESKIAVTVANLLSTDSGIELQDSILELLANLAEQECVKQQLAACGLCCRLLELLETHAALEDDDDAQQFTKLASDLLVLLLTGDSSMEILYDGGQGAVYQASLRWLTARNVQLQMAGALAIGNFARSDGQCVSLVESGATEALIRLLQQDTADGSLLHAAFSALRNLAIPAGNKRRMLDCGLLDAILPHITVDLAPVQFKLLGTLRMVCDKQEEACVRLGTDDKFMARLAEWCTVEVHAGVKGEATRLVACLVKNAQSSAVMESVVRSGCFKHLVSMLTSEYALMQNEALVALNLIAAAVSQSLPFELMQNELVPALKVLLTEDDATPEILCNALSLVGLLAKSDDIKRILKIADFPKIVKSLSKKGNSKVQSSAKSVNALLG